MDSDNSSFELEILNQHWIGPKPDHDVCSHGAIRSVIGGTVVTSPEDDYGISQSALLLLRTVEEDFSEPVYETKSGWLGLSGSVTRSDKPFVHYLLCHGCGYPSSFGCTNFGTSWNVSHEGDQVLLSDAVLHSPELRGYQTAFDVSARISLADYRRKVVAFAEEAHRFYFAAPPRVVDEFERPFHEAFWAEYEERLGRAQAANG